MANFSIKIKFKDKAEMEDLFAPLFSQWHAHMLKTKQGEKLTKNSKKLFELFLTDLIAIKYKELKLKKLQQEAVQGITVPDDDVSLDE